MIFVSSHLRFFASLFILPAALHAVVIEDEPNNDAAHANPVQCGDTVYCAQFSPWSDPDHFRFTAIIGDSIILTTFSCEGSQTDTWLLLFDDQDSVLAANDNGGPGNFSQIRYAAPATAEYVVRVLRNQESVDSTYNLLINCPHPAPEAYDLCETARVISALPYYNEGSTAGATHQAGTPSPDVFYRFSTAIEGTFIITVCSELFDARVQILGFCIGDYGDDASEGCDLGAALTVYFLPPGQHLILVEGTAANQIGDFSLEVTAQLSECPRPEDVVLTRVGGYPFLDWPQLEGPMYYVVWQSNVMNGEYEHLGTTVFTYFTDSTGYAASRKFYYVTAVCPW